MPPKAKYWPFEVVASPSPEQQKEVRFLEEAHRLGYRPSLCGSDYHAVSNAGRVARVIWRGRRRREGPTEWEILLDQDDQNVVEFWLDDFDYVENVVLMWLQGKPCSIVLKAVEGRIVKGPRLEDVQTPKNDSSDSSIWS